MHNASILLWRTLLFMLLAITAGAALAQNSMAVHAVSGNAGDTVTVTLSVTNADSITALQTDLPLGQQLQYINGSAAVTSRSAGHTMHAGIISGNTLRLLLYSGNKGVLGGNSGGVLTFRLLLGNIPGQYGLQHAGPVLSNLNSVNVLSSAINGSVTILAPDLSVSTAPLSFGRAPYYTSVSRQVTLYNRGTAPLQITRMYSSNPYFIITGDTAAVVQPGSNYTVTLQFRSLRKGNYTETLYIKSNDPDQPLGSIPLNAVSYTVNELRLQAVAGRSGYLVELPVHINNMERFTAVQFDLLLPPAVMYTGSPAVLGGRQNGHLVSVSAVVPGRIRVVVWSASNQYFTDSLGLLLKVPLQLNGMGSINTIRVDSAVIADSAGANIHSASYPANATITAPDINGQKTVNLGSTALTDTLRYNYILSNTGTDTLVVASASFIQTAFTVTASLPIIIPQGQSRQLPLAFHAPARGTHSAELLILSNDPDENPFTVSVTATAYAPNYFSAANTSGRPGDTITLEFHIANYDTIVAFQADLLMPPGFTYVPNSAALTSRRADHSISIGAAGGTAWRLFAYSLSQQAFTGSSGAVAICRFTAPAAAGNYPVTVSGVILSNARSQNVLYASQNGSIVLYPVPQPPAMVTPANGATHIRPLIACVWHPSPASAHYRLQVAGNAEFTQPVIDTTTADTLFLCHGLLYGTSYWWRLRGENGGGTGAWSPAWNFSTLGVPSAARPAAPINGALHVPITEPLAWYAPPPRELVTAYRILLAMDTLAVPVITDSSVADTFKAVPLINASTYYWNVRARNEAGWGSTSPWQRFTTIAAIPPAPVLVSPEQYATGIPLSPVLQWRQSAGAVTYRLQVGTNASFTQVLVDDSLLTDTFRVCTGLIYGTTYYWRVRAANAAGAGSYTLARSFRTMAMPVTAPGSLSAANTGLRRVRLTWTDNSSNELGFVLWRKEGDSSNSAGLLPLDSVSANITSYTDTTVSNGVLYSYLVTAFSADTVSAQSNYAVITTLSGAEPAGANVAGSYYLGGNYPNPFNPETGFWFGMAVRGHVEITVVSVSGELIQTIISAELAAGEYRAAWNGRRANGLPAPSGIYFIRMQVPGKVFARKAVLAR